VFDQQAADTYENYVAFFTVMFRGNCGIQWIVFNQYLDPSDGIFLRDHAEGLDLWVCKLHGSHIFVDVGRADDRVRADWVLTINVDCEQLAFINCALSCSTKACTLLFA